MPDSQPISDGPIDRMKLREVVSAFLGGDDRPGMLVRQLLMIAIWHESYFRRSAMPAADVVGAGR